jgi:NAD(P)-dependent dehydrogenase (short-subunit alcohol dehydrogenase family)
MTGDANYSPVAVVTGASRGIGRGIAVALAQKGWRVVINYRGNMDAAQETFQMVENAGSQGLLVQGNIALAADRENLVQATLNTFGGVDLLVNNAGMGPRVRVDILQTTEESYDEVMEVNLKGPYFLTQRVAQVMVDAVRSGKKRLPQIINISSVSSYATSTNRGEYCLSKAGMSMITALFADRLAEFGIGVFEIRPGIIETDMTAKVKAKYDALLEQGFTPIRRWGQPEDVAKAVLAITEGYFPFSTGEILNVDGGFHLRRL